jgi:hypothetical protein
MPETYEMLRILNFVKEIALKYKRALIVPIEFASFVESLETALQAFATDETEEAEHTYWDASNTARETYRKSIVTYFDGATVDLSHTELDTVITLMQEKTEAGIARALKTNKGLSPSYFFHSCVDFIPINGSKPATAECKKFNLNTLPLFLEPQ